MIRQVVAADGTPLALYGWTPTAALRGTVVLVHGLGEHLGRHAALAERLAAEGLLVMGADLRGHGRSGGLRGHISRFDDYLDDLLLVLGAARQASPAGTLWLIGHSLGALIALRFVEQRRVADLTGLVLSAIGVDPVLAIPTWKRLLAGIGAYAFPRLPVTNEIDPTLLSRDPAVRRAYLDDPLVQHVVTPAWYREFESARVKAVADAGRVTVPVLVIHGEADAIVSAEGSRRVAGALGAADVTLRIYPGARHEVLNDGTCPEVLTDLSAWMTRVEAGAVRRAS